jgi:hypothetical protein
VRDRNQNAAYRTLYSTCHQKFSLGVPFTQRFWEVAIQQGESNGGCGHIGMITTNSFMKREFGKKLIEEFFPKIDLTHVVDTSGAYIPGHGTPTVILLGRSRKPVTDTVRAVLGIKGEPTTPENAAEGCVWRSIVKHIDEANTQDDYTSTADVPRTTFNDHPWSIGGGGAADVMEDIEGSANQTLGELASSIGITCFTLEDDVYILPVHAAARRRIPLDQLRQMVVGDMLRDWSSAAGDAVVFPYGCDFSPTTEGPRTAIYCYLWPFRTNLSNSKMFGGKTKVEAGLEWFEYGRLTQHKLRTPLSIAIAFVATHNHFVLDRGGKVFNRSAPIIKLRTDASEDDHLGLLGLLNSSAACFWMQQTFHNKGGPGGGSSKDEKWHDFFEFSATALERFPVGEHKPLDVARKMDKLGQQYQALLPEALSATIAPKAEGLASAKDQAAAIRGQMFALQEELDWQCYQLYGLLPDDLRYQGDDLPNLVLGERAFEIVVARQVEAGTLSTKWFEWLDIQPMTTIPNHWPAAYRKLVERRIKLIEANKGIGLIEKPDCKRRWETEPWDEQEQRALKNWLVDRLEDKRYWPRIELQSTAQLADRASADAEFMQVAALYRGRPDFDLAALVAELVEGESVPFLPILRYKPSGLRKREVWERTWDLQRQEDERARRRKALDDKLGQIRTRITKGFEGEFAKLKKMEARFREEAVKVRDDHAPRVKVERGWGGNAIVDALRNERLKDEGGVAFRALLASSKEISEFKEGIQKKINQKTAADAEYQAAEKERVAIPDDPEIPVPPKYASADFQKSDYWGLRGKLDVPKERWISYPHCQSVSDPTLVVGWAGWNHLEQATALVTYYDARKREGWEAKRLTPLLAGLQQLLPWIHQWHPEIDKEFGETAGKSYESMLEHDALELGLTLEDLRNWKPPETATRRRTRK